MMKTARVITFRADSEKVVQLDSLAKAMDRDRSYLINEAVEHYLSRQRRFTELVEEGLRASQRGELIDDDEFGARMESWIRDKETRENPPGKKQAEGKKVRARA